MTVQLRTCSLCEAMCGLEITVEAGRVILAAGLGNATLGPQLGFAAPVRPQRGQVLITEKLPPLTGEIIEKINQYSWPGNVRELRNTLRRYVTLKKFDTLDPSLFALDNSTEPIDTLDKKEPLESDRDNLRSAIKTFEKEHITDVLIKHRWQRNQAATALGINRKTLFRKIQRHGIE